MPALGVWTLLEWQVRRDAFQKMGHVLRIGSMVLILLLLMISHLESYAWSSNTPGLYVLRKIGWLNLALITLAAIGPFATVISSEREERTIDLMLLAGMSPLAILFGKSTSQLLAALMVFAGQIPFALLTMGLGGVTGTQVLAVYVILAAYLILAANIGLLMSVCSSRSGTSSRMTLTALALLNVGPRILQIGLPFYFSATQMAKNPWLLRIDHDCTTMTEWAIDSQLIAALDLNSADTLLSMPALVSAVLGCVLLILACGVFSLTMRYPDAPPVEPMKGIRRPSQRPWKLPLLWKDFRFLVGGWPLFWLRVAVVVVGGTLASIFRERIFSLTGVTAQGMCLSTLVGLVLVEGLFSAARLLQSEQANQSLDSLLLLPQSLVVILYSKMLGCLLGALPWIVALAGMLWMNPTFAHNRADYWATVGSCGVIYLIWLHLTVLFSLTHPSDSVVRSLGVLLIVVVLLWPGLAVFGNLARLIDPNSTIPVLSPILFVGCAVCGWLQLAIYLRTAAAGGR